MNYRWITNALAAALLAVTACATGQQGHRAAAFPQARSTTSQPTTPAGASANEPLAVFGVTATGAPSTVRCPQWLVLAADRLQYTDDEFRGMANLFAGGLFAANSLPTTLRWAPGSPTATKVAMWQPSGCRIDLQLTNTTSAVIEVRRVGFQLTRLPAANAESYRLVEACSTQGDPKYCGPNLGGGPGRCDVYDAKVELAGGGAGTAFLATPASTDENGQPCPQIALQPAQSVEVLLSANSSQNFLYGVEPAVEIGTSTGTNTILVPRLANTMSFAAPAQFTCYQRHGNVFVGAWIGEAALDFNGRARDAAWCA